MINKYNKLVRDRIPEIIKNQGHFAVYHRLSQKEFVEKLFEKLTEEQKELVEAQNIEEITDVIEVLLSIARLYGYTEQQTLEHLYKKRMEKGGFLEGYLLEEVHLGS